MKSITIGRSSDCDIVLTYDKISRIHANVSLVEGQYIYQDVSRNGSNISGQIIMNQKMVVAPGTPILLANKTPLPWERVYALLPLSGYKVNKEDTLVQSNQQPNYQQSIPQYNINQQQISNEGIGFGLGLLAFLIPLAGWIMYIVWKDETPKRASQAGLIGTISFILGILSLL